MIDSICIVRLSALGDVLMLVPLVRTLQTHFPKASITWVITRPAYDLVEKISGIEFVVLEKPRRLKDYWQFYRQFKHRHFDVLLATQASLRANLLYPLIPATRKVGFDKVRAKDGHGLFVSETITPGQDHTLESFLKFADRLGVTRTEVRWDLPISEDEHHWAAARLSPKEKPIMLVNPAASKEERGWLVERYVAVIQEVQKRWNARVILIGGPGPLDLRLGEQIRAETNIESFIGQTKLKQLIALISQADVLLCPDTGPSHMAAAVGTPVVALHAVTPSAVSGPYPFRHLAVDCYAEAVRTILKKTPETTIWGTHAHGSETMKLISTHAVIEKLALILDNLKS